MSKLKLIFIGDHFYSESKTMMSCLYSTKGVRYDWGFVNEALRKGLEVNIRPATEEELKFYQHKLDTILFKEL